MDSGLKKTLFQTEIVEPIHILSKEFSRTVTKECFQGLLSLLQWSWNTFKWGIMEGSAVKNFYTNLELDRLVYISTSSLRLLCTYTNEIYPRWDVPANYKQDLYKERLQPSDQEVSSGERPSGKVYWRRAVPAEANFIRQHPPADANQKAWQIQSA